MELVRLSKYSEIVVLENKSLNQQVVVMNEIIQQKETEVSKLKSDLSASHFQVCVLKADMITFSDCRQSLERETRLNAGLKDNLKHVQDQQKIQQKQSIKEIEELEQQLSLSVARINELKLES